MVTPTIPTTVPQIDHVDLVRPDETIRANWLGRFGDTDFVYLRYLQYDSRAGQFVPVQLTAQYCPVHQICFLPNENLGGCPKCSSLQVEQRLKSMLPMDDLQSSIEKTCYDFLLKKNPSIIDLLARLLREGFTPRQISSGQSPSYLAGHIELATKYMYRNALHLEPRQMEVKP